MNRRKLFIHGCSEEFCVICVMFACCVKLFIDLHELNYFHENERNAQLEQINLFFN